MRLINVIPSLAARTGGPALGIVEASRALQQVGVETRIIATDMAAAARSAGRRGRVTRDGLPAGCADLNVELCRTRPPYRWAYSPGLKRSLRQVMPEGDVVHIQSLFLYPQLAAYRAARAHDRPYLVSPRGALDPWLRTHGRLRKAATDLAWQRRMLCGAAAIHVTSEQEANFIEDIAPRVPRAIVPNGIRWRAFQSPAEGMGFRRRFLGGFDGPLVLVHGRLTAKKGLDLLIRALAGVAKRIPTCRLALVGPDDDGLAPALASVAAESGVAQRVTFCGMLRGRELLAALAAADVWALPSYTENFAIAAAEALAAGVPVVLSKDVGIAQSAADAGAAIISPRDPDKLATSISALLEDPATASALGIRARSHARRYDWSRVAPQLAGMYKRAIR